MLIHDRMYGEPQISFVISLNHPNRTYSADQTIELRLSVSGMNVRRGRIRVGAILNVIEKYTHLVTEVSDITIIDVDRAVGEKNTGGRDHSKLQD